MNIKVFLSIQLMILGFWSFATNQVSPHKDTEPITVTLRNEDVLKHGQYVYVTLKDGSKTLAKIVGRKNARKYYVLEVNGSHKGLVHIKYIAPLSKEEVLKVRNSSVSKGR